MPIFRIDDETGHWYICDVCGKTDTFNSEKMRNELASKHVCVIVSIPVVR